MNHHRDGISHKSITKCVYQHQFENKRYYCRQCYDRGEEVSVIPKTSASSESTWVGLAKYAMSGYVLECNRCGVIYRSRQYWYGNQEPWDCVRTEIEHIWAGEPGPCQGTQNAAQKVLDSVSYLSETGKSPVFVVLIIETLSRILLIVSTISARPARTVGSWVADQIAPTYWIPNSRILVRFLMTCCGSSVNHFYYSTAVFVRKCLNRLNTNITAELVVVAFATFVPPRKV